MRVLAISYFAMALFLLALTACESDPETVWVKFPTESVVEAEKFQRKGGAISREYFPGSAYALADDYVLGYSAPFWGLLSEENVRAGVGLRYTRVVSAATAAFRIEVVAQVDTYLFPSTEAAIRFSDRQQPHATDIDDLRQTTDDPNASVEAIAVPDSVRGWGARFEALDFPWVEACIQRGFVVQCVYIEEGERLFLQVPSDVYLMLEDLDAHLIATLEKSSGAPSLPDPEIQSVVSNTRLTDGALMALIIFGALSPLLLFVALFIFVGRLRRNRRLRSMSADERAQLPPDHFWRNLGIGVASVVLLIGIAVGASFAIPEGECNGPNPPAECAARFPY